MNIYRLAVPILKLLGVNTDRPCSVHLRIDIMRGGQASADLATVDYCDHELVEVPRSGGGNERKRHGTRPQHDQVQV